VKPDTYLWKPANIFLERGRGETLPHRSNNADDIVEHKVRIREFLRKDTVEDLLNLLLFYAPGNVQEWLRKNQTAISELIGSSSVP
jgi:hypothetical protein